MSETPVSDSKEAVAARAVVVADTVAATVAAERATVGDLATTDAFKLAAEVAALRQSVAALAAVDAEALTKSGQRRINLIWEATQGIGAVFLIGSACAATLLGRELPSEFWLLVGIVVTAYYQRTNHTKVGGVSGVGER